MSPVPPDSEGYVPPVFPAFPFKVEVNGRPTLRSYHGSSGQNLGQVPEGTVVWATERDGAGEFDLWLRLKNAPTNDHPDGRDGWVLARNCTPTTEDPTPPPVEPPVDPPPVEPPVEPPPVTDLTQLEGLMVFHFLNLVRAFRAYILS